MIALVVAVPTAPTYLRREFPDGTTALGHLQERVEVVGDSLSDDAGPPVVLINTDVSAHTADFPDDWNTVAVRTTTGESPAAAAFSALDRALPSTVRDIVWIAFDGPFFDVNLTRYLFELHRSAHTDYTFADGFPTGYSPEILRRSALPVLQSMVTSTSLKWTRTVLFDALSYDINAFDIETEAARDDFELERLSPTVDVLQNWVLCRRLIEQSLVDRPETRENPPPEHARYTYDHATLLRAFLENPGIARTRPFYYQVQITDARPQSPIHAPPESEQSFREMDVATWSGLLDRIEEFTPEAIIAIGYRGEPAYHSAFAEIVREVEKKPGLQLYIETSGIGWSEAALEALASPAVAAVIVELDSIDKAQYRQIRGEGFDEAMRTINTMLGVAPDRVYVQATRMEETEWDLHAFFQHWDRTEGATPLVQKYNTWAGRLPDRRSVNLEPPIRTPCRRLQRDAVILIDGTMPRCFQDLDGEAIRGNVVRDGMSSAWSAGTPDFDAHVREEYPALCRKCDEYYIFNA